MVLCGISTCFQVLSPCEGQIAHALLTRPPLKQQPKPLSPLDLHVLGTPPAFVLSQNQTLMFNSSIANSLMSAIKLSFETDCSFALEFLPELSLLSLYRFQGSSLFRSPGGLIADSSYIITHPSSFVNTFFPFFSGFFELFSGLCIIGVRLWPMGLLFRTHQADFAL